MLASTRNRLVIAALVVAVTVVLAHTLARPADPASSESRKMAPAIPVVDVHSVAATPLECERVAFAGGRSPQKRD
jgi:hypothetical protein